MQFKKWVLTSLSLIVLYLSVMAMLWTTAKLKNHPQDELTQFLPKNTKLAVRVYSENIVRSFFQELFFYNADDSTQNEIENYIEKFILKVDTTTERPQNILDNLKGIDLYNDILIFQFSEQNIEYSGMLCHITDSAAFNAFDTKNQLLCVHSNKTVGIILQTVHQNNQSHTLKQMARKVLTSHKSNVLGTKRTSREALADVYVRIDTDNNASDLTLKIDGNSEKISFKGKITPFDSKMDNSPAYVLQGKNLSFSLRYIPDSLKKQIRNWCIQNSIPDFELHEIQMNYEGLDIELTPSNLAIKPKFEAIFKTVKNTSIKNHLSNAVLLEKIGGKLDDNFVAINNSKYYFEQLDSCTFYLGNNSKPVFEKRFNPDLLSIRGNLSHLTNIQTGGMDFLLNVVPLYSALNRYFTNSQNLNVKITPNSTTSLIEGNLDFKKDKNALFESFFLFLEIQAVNKLLK